MFEAAAAGMPPPSRDLSCKAAIVGLGETDYHRDYQAARTRAPGYELPTPESLASSAFERALADSGLRREDIDGLSVSFIYGGPSGDEMAQLLGVRPRHVIEGGGIMAGPLPIACAAIAAGKCDTVAMIYAAASRAIGRQYGGRTYDGDAAPSSYYYYHPWGWSSQAAHWAFVWSHYQATYGASEADLGAVAVQLRKHAQANPNAVMQAPLSIQSYLDSRYIVRPLHLFDLCLVNDGAVCLIVRRADMARNLPHAPVLVAGWGEAIAKGDKLHNLVRERLRPQLQEAGDQAFRMAGLTASDVQHFEGYDASTIHLISQLEGHGFVEPGAGLEFCKSGGMAVDGALPVNTGGGMLSASYMHGWNHVAEITRQLRHEAGPQQVKDVEVSMFSLAQTDRSHPIVFVRGG
ncbi:thiolase family protein [Phenylobacterium sp. LjRoot225]|uniref:thiolase family protein n=1 Tax=Phenylobacterium sp. LjRoot225 TaxID=3342285 RepID=UPI003ED0377F